MALIRSLVLASAISAVAGGAQAQTGAFGAFVPYEVNGPAAAFGAPPGSNADSQGHCGWAAQGRSGGRYSCDGENPRADDPRARER